MPSYKVTAQGFFGGVMYHPEGKRSVLHTDKPFPSKNKKEQVPSWLERIKDETPTQARKRKAAEKKAAEAASAEAAEQKEAVDGVTFLDDNKSTNVETLG